MCSIPISTLTNSPFNLMWGQSVRAKVIASNIVGDSLESFVGNGAKLTRKPDPPINL